MLQLTFIGDGKRDAATIPPIVERILNTSVGATCRPWARLHEGNRKTKGYARKLLYALRQARDCVVHELVATVDADKERKGRRLRELRRGRDADRSRFPGLPTALGEAVPHGEAWLLDDAVAVSEALQLGNDVRVPTVMQSASPKETLHELLRNSPRAAERPLDVWGGIARRVDPSHCKHARRTGFHAFVNELQHELGPLGGTRQSATLGN